MKRVLIVDDEPNFLRAVVDGLSAYSSLSVETATNGAEALAKLTGQPGPDLLITDLNMPVMDGFELLAHLTARHPPLPTMVITAFGSPDVRARLEKLGDIALLEKPLDIYELTERIFAALTPGDRGYLPGVISLATFLQLLQMERKTCHLTVTANGASGELCLVEGQVTYARCGALRGDDAAHEIIAWGEARIAIDGLCRNDESNVTSGLTFLIMDSLRRKDELAARPGARADHAPAPPTGAAPSASSTLLPSAAAANGKRAPTAGGGSSAAMTSAATTPAAAPHPITEGGTSQRIPLPRIAPLASPRAAAAPSPGAQAAPSPGAAAHRTAAPTPAHRADEVGTVATPAPAAGAAPAPLAAPTAASAPLAAPTAASAPAAAAPTVSRTTTTTRLSASSVSPPEDRAQDHRRADRLLDDLLRSPAAPADAHAGPVAAATDTATPPTATAPPPKPATVAPHPASPTPTETPATVTASTAAPGPPPSSPSRPEQPVPFAKTTKEQKMSIETQLQSLRDIRGYRASAVLNFTGEVLVSDSVDQTVDLALVGATFNDIFRSAHEASRKIGLDATRETVIKTPKGLIVMTCSGLDSKIHFHVIAVLGEDGNQALLKMRVDGMMPKIMSELG